MEQPPRPASYDTPARRALLYPPPPPHPLPLHVRLYAALIVAIVLAAVVIGIWRR